MEKNRLKLHQTLVEILGSDHVYFQPPESLKLKYPAITYSRSTIDNVMADDAVYLRRIEYTVIVIDADPSSEIVDKMSLLQYARHINSYKSNGFNHDVFRITY